MGEHDRDLIGVQILPHFTQHKAHIVGKGQCLGVAAAVAVVEAGEGKKPAVLRRHALRKRLQHAGRQDHTVQSQVLQLLWVSKPCRKPLLDVLDHRPRFRRLKGAADVDITGMVITVDRMERALEGEKSAVQSVYEKYGVPVYSIVNMEDIIQGIRDEVIPGKEHLDAMLAYREQYGVKA